MKTIESLIDKHVGESALIVCAGSMVKEKWNDIVKFMGVNNPFTIGINNMTGLFIPDYHLWTNTKRFRTYGRNIKKASNVLLGSGIHLKTVREVIGMKPYTLINFTDMKEGVPIDYKKGKIHGFYRTAGCLSIMVAHLMGAREVNIVGMDGHTLHDYNDVKKGITAHHCYEENYKPYSKEMCVKKDRIITGVLGTLRDYGIDLKILTPTVYKEFYGGF